MALFQFSGNYVSSCMSSIKVNDKRKNTERDRDRERETDIQTERERQREIHRERERQRQVCVCTYTVQNKLRTNCSQPCQRQSFELNDLKF